MSLLIVLINYYPGGKEIAEGCLPAPYLPQNAAGHHLSLLRTGSLHGFLMYSAQWGTDWDRGGGTVQIGAWPTMPRLCSNQGMGAHERFPEQTDQRASRGGDSPCSQEGMEETTDPPSSALSSMHFVKHGVQESGTDGTVGWSVLGMWRLSDPQEKEDPGGREKERHRGRGPPSGSRTVAR